MKYRVFFNYVIASIVTTVTATLWAVPELIKVQQSGQNVVYTYEVSGEDIHDPQKTSYLYGMSDLPYALCSKALCRIDKNHPNKATCDCPIYGLKGDKNWQKASVGPKDLDQTQPTQTNGKLETVVSNYSKANLKNRHASPQTTCPSKELTPWANCFGVRCHVVYDGTSKPEAVCECPLVRTKGFVSIGPESTAQCQQGRDKAWSAATKQQGENNNDIIKQLYSETQGDS